MSLSRIAKFIGPAGFAAFMLITPPRADAAEFVFQDKTWTATPIVSTVQGYAVRNDFDVSSFVKQGFSKHPYEIETVGLDEATLKVLDEASTAINQDTKAAHMVLNAEGTFATEFEPGQNGQRLDIYKTARLVADANTSDTTIELPIQLSKPNTTLAETNSIGITELVAIGESDFSGSTTSRKVNVRVGSSRFQGLIIQPGAEFSFNTWLGEVDGQHGFLPELVIKKTGVAPEFGGGLCQVSSTAFRAAMNAGFPITARRNHSFAVHYYSPQGTDATIYPGVQDMKFINDLKSPLLIRTRMDVAHNKLYFEFYGTKDDRKITFDGPYQFDKKANGAMKAVWTRWVEKDDQKTEQVFNSNYQPPALFQQNTQATTPNPQAVTENPTPTPPTDQVPTGPNPPPAPNPAPTT